MTGLGKNRVFDISEIERLRNVGCQLLEAGIGACAKWDNSCLGLKQMENAVPGNIRSSLLSQSLSQVESPLAKQEYEDMNLQLGHILGKLAENMPLCDADAAQSIEISIIEADAAIIMLRSLMEYIDLAGTDIESLEYINSLLQFSAIWQETELTMDQLTEYSRTILKGLPEYTKFMAILSIWKQEISHTAIRISA